MFAKSRKLRLLTCGHDLKFITPFIERCQASNLYDVRIYDHGGHHIDSEETAREHLKWADVIFCEWALGNAVWYSHHKRDDQILIVRLHLQEMHARDRLSFIWETDWSRVDRLVLITQHVYDWMRAEFPVLQEKAALIYNPIDAVRGFNKPKPADARFVLGLVGIVPARKRIDLAVDLLREVRKHDDRFILRVKGKQPADYPWMKNRRDEMAWYDSVYAGIDQSGLKDAVLFDPQGSDMPDWYARVGHILSVSDFEGSHQAVAEGMAAGCVPAIRNWTGADRIYPPKYVGSTTAELADLIQRHTDSDVFETQSTFCRAFAQDRFDNEHVCNRLEALLLQACRAIRPGVIEIPGAAAKTAHLPTFLIVAYVPPGNRGGYRIRVEQEIKALVQTGCRVHLACLVPENTLPQAGAGGNGNSQAAGPLAEHEAELAACGCSVHFVPVKDFFRIDMAAGETRNEVEHLSTLVRDHGVDIVHCEALYCGRLGSFLKENLPGITFSIDWHGVIPEEERMNGAHENRIHGMEKWEKRLLASCDLNVFVSNAMKAHYDEKYAPGNTQHVIVPCCVSDERFVKAGNAATPQSLGLPEGRPILAYAGTMAGWQCGEEMIRLFAALHTHDPEIFFLLLVPENDHLKVLNWADQHALPREAFLLKEVTHDEVPRYLGVAHAGVLLRKEDPVNRVSSPTKFGEYLAAGLPVIMTDCIGDFSEFATATETGLVLDGDPGSVAGDANRILEYLHESRLQQRKVASRCHGAAGEELHWESAVRTWLKVFGNAGRPALSKTM